MEKMHSTLQMYAYTPKKGDSSLQQTLPFVNKKCHKKQKPIAGILVEKPSVLSTVFVSIVGIVMRVYIILHMCIMCGIVLYLLVCRFSRTTYMPQESGNSKAHTHSRTHSLAQSIGR